MTPRHSPTRDFTTRRSGASERNAGVLLLHPRPAPQLRWSSRLLVLARRRPGRRWPSAGSVQLRGHDLHGRPGAAVLGRPGPLLEPAHDHDPAALGQRLGGRWGLAVRPSTVRIRTSPSWEFRADGRPSSRAWEMTYRGTDLLNAGRSPGSAAHRVPGCRQVAPQTPLPPSGWLKNGCAVLPAPDREWLHRGLSLPQVGLPSQCLRWPSRKVPACR
jgi:hypothetical protein